MAVFAGKKMNDAQPVTPTSEQASSQPLMAMPPELLHELINALRKPPFYKRHPLLCLLVLIFLVGIIVLLVNQKDEETLSTDGDCLALISVKGPIIENQGLLKWIRKIEHTKEIKGVLLRVDSPGGGASSSEELYAALARLGEQKPIVVSMGSVAASGGLMVAMAGKRVFANKATITGSIGVRMDILQAKGLMDKLGLGQETLVTGPYKDAGSSMRPLTEEDRRYLKSILNELNEQFMAIIAKSRGLSQQEVQKLATGRIYTGREALEVGLIDAIGGQEEAHAWLAKQTGVNLEKKLLARPKERKWYEELLTSLLDLPALHELAELQQLVPSYSISY
ncbi:MAG: signal peptide peptidase SppA [Desulfovibrio sp.]|nr:signal peptide peptidase SppA [Desulfovibrio sp.]